MRKEQPDVPFAEVTKILGVRWTELSAEEKEVRWLFVVLVVFCHTIVLTHGSETSGQGHCHACV